MKSEWGINGIRPEYSQRPYENVYNYMFFGTCRNISLNQLMTHLGYFVGAGILVVEKLNYCFSFYSELHNGRIH